MTIFHNSKLSLHKHFQMLVAIDLFSEELCAREIAALVNMSERTIKLHLDKHLRVDPKYLEIGGLLIPSAGSLIDVLQKARAGVNSEELRARVRSWLNI